MLPEVGQYLNSTCRGEDFGQVLRVGVDANGCPVIDILLFCYDVFTSAGMDSTDDPAGDPGQFGFSPLTGIDFKVPEGVKVDVVLTDVQYRITATKAEGSWADFIECNTPGNGCYRCDKSFVLETREERRVFPTMHHAQ